MKLTKELTDKLNTLFRYCDDIGMFCCDRPIDDVKDCNGNILAKGSCRHKTKACEECFNVKLYRIYKDMMQRDIRCEAFWNELLNTKINVIQKALNAFFKRKRKQTKRVRFMSRGEAISTEEDVYLVHAMVTADPEKLWWMPTRAWTDPKLFKMIKQYLLPLPNLALNLSIDHGTNPQIMNQLQEQGFNLMYFGDDEYTTLGNGTKMFKCPKTWKGLKGHCSICKAGCFSQPVMGRQTVVHLKKH